MQIFVVSCKSSDSHTSDAVFTVVSCYYFQLEFCYTWLHLCSEYLVHIFVLFRVCIQSVYSHFVFCFSAFCVSLIKPNSLPVGSCNHCDGCEQYRTNPLRVREDYGRKI